MSLKHMLVCFPNGKRKALRSVRSLIPLLWQVQAVLVTGSEQGWTARFKVLGGRIYIGLWDDGKELWDWLHSRRVLKGCPLDWQGDDLIISREHVGKYPEKSI